MNVLDFRSGFMVTDATGHEVVTVLPCRLRFRGGLYGEVQTLFRSVALDQRTIHVEEFTGGAEEVRAAIRYHGDADALRALLREGSRGRTLTYYPDLAIPGEAYPVQLMSHGPVVEIAPDAARFAYGEWEAGVTLRRIDGGSLVPLVSRPVLAQVTPSSQMALATFARASAGTRISAARRIESIATGLRRLTWVEVNGILRPAILVEPARGQVAANPQAPNSWSDAGTPVVTTGITDPFGGTAAILVEDNDGADFEGKSTVPSFTGAGTKTVAVMLAPGTAAVVSFLLYDEGAPATVVSLDVTWNGGTTAPTVVAGGAGAETVFDPVPVYDEDGRLWWLVLFNATGVVAANAHRLYVRVGPAASDTGTFYLAGANAWDAPVPASWQGPTLASRAADELVVPCPAAVFPTISLYAAFVEQGTFAAAVDNAKVAVVGNSGNDSFQIDFDADPNPHYRISGSNGVSVVTAALPEAAAPAIGDLVEILAWKRADGTLDGQIAINGGTPQAATPSSALTWLPAFTDPAIAIGHRDGAFHGTAAFLGVLFAKGIQDLAFFRRRVGL